MRDFEFKVPLSKARDELGELVNQAEYNSMRYAITRRGKPVAAIVPIEDLDWLEETDERLDVIDAQKIERMRAAGELEERIPWEVVKRELGLE